MSSSVQQSQLSRHSLPSDLTPNQASVLGPGLVGILIQGIESGLVIAQSSQWYSRPDRNGSYVITMTVIFVTIVGLYASSRLFSASSHSFIKCTDWDIICISLV